MALRASLRRYFGAAESGALKQTPSLCVRPGAYPETAALDRPVGLQPEARLKYLISVRFRTDTEMRAAAEWLELQIRHMSGYIDHVGGAAHLRPDQREAAPKRVKSLTSFWYRRNAASRRQDKKT